MDVVDTTGTFMMPSQSSTMAGEVDALFYFIYYISVFFFALITGLIILFSIRYKRRGKPGLVTGATRNKALEIIWTVVPSIIVFIIFGWGFKDFIRLRVIPHDAYEIKVTGRQWQWDITYSEGITVVNELVIPVGRPVTLLMSSRDVIHAFFIPSFRVKMDVLPNRYTSIWFEATREGAFPLFCAEFCGQQHSLMRGTVRAVSQEEFDIWISENSNILEGVPNLAEGGELIYNRFLCYTCHSTDGSAGNGPTWRGLFGTMERLDDGTEVLVDENYIRESILNPKAKVVAGYEPIMSTYQGTLKPEYIDAVIEYIKTLRN